MLNSNIKYTFRNIFRNKIYFIINLLGLSLGLAIVFIIFLYIQSETGYDNCHINKDSIFRLTYFDSPTSKITPNSSEQFAEDIVSMVPEIQHSALIGNLRSQIEKNNQQIELQGKGVNTDVFKMFTVPFLSGGYKELAKNPYSIIISEKLKNILFPSEIAEGKFIDMIINHKKTSFVIIGIIENLPKKSSLQAEFFIPYKSLPYISKMYLTEHYIQIKKEFVNSVKDKVDKLIASSGALQTVIPQPLRDIHFNCENFTNNRTPTGDLNKIFILASIGLLILICSMINYVVLATSRTLQKLKDIAVHKVFGSGQLNIVFLIISESLLVTFMAVPIALILCVLFLPLSGELLQIDLSIKFMYNLPYVMGISIISLFTGILSGFYTSYISLKISPIEIFARRKLNIRQSYFQKGLLVLQLMVLIGLILFNLIIKNQLKFSNEFEMGFNNKNLLNIDVSHDITPEQFMTFSDEVKKIPGIVNCSYGSAIPTNGNQAGTVQHYTLKELIPVEYVFAGSGYLEMCNIKLISGRYLKDYTNENNNIIINETAVRKLGLIDPLGKIINGQTIIGVVKDFMLHSLHEETPPVIITSKTDDDISTILVSSEFYINNDIKNSIKKLWNNFFPGELFEAFSFNDIYEEMYDDDIKMNKIISVFSYLSIIISCLGLIGLTLLTTNKKVKEIGIRKVNGARSSEIIYLIHSQFVSTYILSLLISLPITVLLSLRWLDNFAYSISINIIDIAITIIVSFLIFSIPIILVVYKASKVNPVKALRNE